MEINQLRYFVAVAETGGFARAARRCGVTQPSLSQQIQKLERELGQLLFDRLGRTIKLTAAGEVLLPRAQGLVAEFNALKRSVDNEILSGAGSVAVGMIPTIAPYLMPGALARFSARYPRAEIRMFEDVTTSLVDMLVNARIDLAIMSLPLDHKSIRWEEVAREPLFAAVREGHPLAASRRIGLADLEAEPFILLHEEHCLGAQIESLCHARETQLQVVSRTSQLSTARSCVASGIGVTLVPQLAVAADEGTGIVYREIEEPRPFRSIVGAWHSGRTRSSLSEAFLEELRAECAERLADPRASRLAAAGAGR